MKTRARALVALFCGVAAFPLHAQEVPPGAGTSEPKEGAAGEETRQETILRGPDGKPLPPGTRMMTVGPDGKLTPVPLGPDGRPVLPRRPALPGGGEREIVVRGEKPRGSVIGDIPPERVLNPLDIRARGASTLGELLESLEPETRSTRGRGDGRPVVLVNGKRVSSFAEVANLPPEAIERTEIFPEELALKYGYRADQKVVNVVTFERFQSTIAQAGMGFVTEGGRTSQNLKGNYLTIRGDTRLNLDVDYSRAGALLESEREIGVAAGGDFDFGGTVTSASPVPGAEIDPALSALAGQSVTRAAVPASASAGAASLASFAAGANSANRTDVRSHRSLLPATERLALNGTVAGPIFDGVSASLNGRFEISESEGRLGFASGQFLLPQGSPFSPFSQDVRLSRYFDPADPLERENETRLAHLGTALNGRLGKWLWAFTGNIDRLSSTTFTDRGPDTDVLQARLNARDPGFNPFADSALGPRMRDEASAVSKQANGETLLSGPLLTLPAGEVSVSVRLGLATQDFESETLRRGIRQSVDLSRDRASVQGNVDLPIARRSEDVLPALGDLSLSLNAEAEKLSNFGTLKTVGMGLNWSPAEGINFNASVTDEEAAPTVQQLGNPIIATPNVPSFDYARGETATVTRIDGGNPALREDSRRVFKLALSAKPLAKENLHLNANYVRSRIEDSIASFPAATPQIEAAFPERFTRDAGGRLLSIDARPVNFSRWDKQELRWGLNYSRALTKAQPGQDVSIRFSGTPLPPGQLPPGLPPGATVVKAEAGSALARQFEGMLSRLFVSLYHSWHIEDEILIRPGLPKLDLLNGGALGTRGGEPRHELDFQAGVFQRGLGAQIAAKWRSGSTVRGFDPAGDLRFSGYGTVNINLFMDLQQRLGGPKAPAWAKATRLSLGITNLFSARPGVRDASGAIPFSYQPAFLDPLGRSVNLSLRKRF